MTLTARNAAIAFTTTAAAANADEGANNDNTVLAHRRH